MANEKLKEWIKNKREEGISDERIKKSLERTDHDPSIVDEMDNPFNKDGSSTQASDEKPDLSEQDEDLEFELSDVDGSDNEAVKDDEDSEEEDSKEVKSHVEDIQQSVNASSKQSLSLVPHFSRKKIGVGVFLVLLVVGGIAAYSFMPDDFNPLESIDVDTGPAAEPGSLEQLDSQYAGCPDSAVRIQSVTSSNGVTTANVKVTREEARVVLTVMQDGEVVDFTTDRILGESTMSVEAVGDQVKLRPLGCKDRYSLRDY